MTLVENHQFAKWLDRVMGESVFEKHSTPARRMKTIIAGFTAKIWRWYHKRMVSTSQYFRTAIHAEEATNSEGRGWTIIEIPARQYVTKSYLFYEIAQGLNREIPQLSHKTQISINGDYPHRLMGHQIPGRDMLKFDAEISPIVNTVEYSTYEIEWKEYAFRVASSTLWRDMDCHYFAMAYDALNDCLYVNYRG